MGTAHVLEALRGLDGARVAVMVTTDKVYRDGDSRRPYRRRRSRSAGTTPTAPARPPAKWSSPAIGMPSCPRQGVAVASARAGNVIGGGDWSEDRLIPDAVRAWQAGQTLEVRRPQAVRPWQHVLEPLGGYLTLARKLWERSALAAPYNFGPGNSETP